MQKRCLNKLNKSVRLLHILSDEELLNYTLAEVLNMYYIMHLKMYQNGRMVCSDIIYQ